jgi:hypothetical protein
MDFGSSRAQVSRPPVPDLVDARRRQSGRFGELLAWDVTLDPLAEQAAAQPSIGGIECAAGKDPGQPTQAILAVTAGSG